MFPTLQPKKLNIRSIKLTLNLFDSEIVEKNSLKIASFSKTNLYGAEVGFRRCIV